MARTRPRIWAQETPLERLRKLGMSRPRLNPASADSKKEDQEGTSVLFGRFFRFCQVPLFASLRTLHFLSLLFFIFTNLD